MSTIFIRNLARMRHTARLAFALVALLFSATKTVAQTPSAAAKTMSCHTNLSGYSNAVVVGGKVHYLVGLDPQANLPGYPDPGYQWSKLVLMNEDGTVVSTIEGNSIADGIGNGADLSINKNGKLCVIDHKPNGNGNYGFRGNYSTLTAGVPSASMMFSNANTGGSPRAFMGNDGQVRVPCFAAAGYYVQMHVRNTSNVWTTYNISGSNTQLWVLEAVLDASDNLHIVGVNSATGALIYYQINAAITSASLATLVPSGCGQVGNVVLDGTDLVVSYTEGLNIKMIRQNAGVWGAATTIGTIGSGEDARPFVYKNAAGVWYAAYQTATQVTVRKQNAGIWNTIHTANLTRPSNTRQPSFVQKSTDTYVIYGGNNKVYLENLTTNVNPFTTTATATTICAGQTATLTANGAGACYTYQWKKNNVNISGATNSTYSATQAGTYRVYINNGIAALAAPDSITIQLSTPITSTRNVVLTPANPSVTVGGQTYTTAGTFTNVYPSWRGCDSTVTTNVTVQTPYQLSTIDSVGCTILTATFQYSVPANVTNAVLYFGEGASQAVTGNGTIQHTFSYPGAYYVGIYENNQLQVSKPIFVENNYIDAHFEGLNGYRSADYARCDVIANGIAHIPTTNQYVWASWSSIHNFGINANECSVSARAQNNNASGGISCYDFSINIFGSKTTAHVSFMEPGCQSYASIGAGSANQSNIAALALDLAAWHDFKIQMHNQVVNIFYDGTLIYSLPYTDDLGTLRGVNISFKGTGNIDRYTVENASNTVIYNDDFSNCNAQPYVLPISATSTALCAGASTTLTATGGTSYAWNTGATAASITVSPTTTTTYTVTVTGTLGCTSTGSIVITVNAVPTASITGIASFCAGGSSILSASDGVTYLWSSGATTAAITVTAADTYTVTTTNTAGCTATVSQTITVNTLPTPSIIVTGATCPKTLTASGGGTYLWNTNATTPSISAASSGTYTVTVTNSAGCTGTASVTVDCCNLQITELRNLIYVHAQAVTFPTPTVTGCAAGSVLTYLWEFGDGTTSTIASPTKTYTNVGVYNVCLTVTCTAANGTFCRAKCCREVNIGKNCPLLYPTFSHTVPAAGLAYTFTGTIQSTSVIPAPVSTYEIYNSTNTLVTTVTGTNATYTFPNSGEYTVCRNLAYTADANYGAYCTGKNCRKITVMPTTGCNATAKFVATTYKANALNVTFNASSYSTGATAYYWEYSTSPTGTFTQLGTAANSILGTPVFLFPSAGIYWVRLTINKGTACETAIIARINLNAFTCTASSSTTPTVARTVNPDGTIEVGNSDINDGIGLYPNPTDSNVTITFGNDIKATTLIRVYDMKGQLITSFRTQEGDSQTVIDLSSQAAGMYLFHIENENGERLVKKVMKQ